MKNKLFLHMGPGFHAMIEESYFSTTYPEIYFWNQPKTKSFSELISCAEKTLLEMHSKTQSKIAIKAHSFGAIIANELVKSHPDKIHSLNMLNSSYNPFNCFLNLSSLNKTEKASLQAKSTNEKMNFIYNIASQENFNKSYWHSITKMQSYLSKACLFPGIDFETFTNVFSSFLDTWSVANLDAVKPVSWNGDVTLFASKDDLLIKLPEDINNWLKIYPQAITEYISGSGHYSLFEDEKLPQFFFN